MESRIARTDTETDEASRMQGEGRADADKGKEVSSSSHEQLSASPNERSVVVNHPWRTKGPALFLVLLLNLGPNWTIASLPPLKSVLIRKLSIDNAQYGSLASASSLVNTIFPVVSGALIDWFGPESSSLVASSCVAVGSVIAGIGASKSSYTLLLSGEVIVGLGTVTLETAQTKIYTYWFYGNHLGFVYGLNLAVGRIVNVMAQATAVPIERSGYWGWSIWILTIMAGVSLALNIVYLVFQRRLPPHLRLATGRQTAKRENDTGLTGKRAHFSGIFKSTTVLPACFWLITLSQSLQIGTVQTYLTLAPSIISTTRSASALTSGYTTAVGQIIPIFLTPFVGFLFDRYGKRMYYVSGTAALYVLVFVLLGFTQVNAYAPVLLGSVALSVNLMPFLATIPLLVPDQAYIGTAYGIWKCFENTGHVILVVGSGAIQDLTPTGRSTYTNVLYLLISLKSIDIILGFFYDALDRRLFGGILRMSEIEKRRKVVANEDGGGGRGMRSVQKGWTAAGLGAGGAMVLIAWVLYLIYSQGTTSGTGG